MAKRITKAINTNVKEIFVNIDIDGMHKKYKKKVDITDVKAIEKARDEIIEQIYNDVKKGEFRNLIDTATSEIANRLRG
jgi:sulfate adenylyltransferase subunit 1 (EFTu-like GTPase family)